MQLLYNLINIYEIVLIARIILSWIRPNTTQPVLQSLIKWIYAITDPILEPVRRLIPMSGMGIDFSPIIIFILIDFLKQVLFKSYMF
ncbi:MAG: YggT family protein [Chitinispirillia bacterium]|jgi:YggT family protein